MNLDTRLEVSSSVVTREIGGEIVLMDLDSGTYFGLDSVGARAWLAIEDGQTIEDLCTQLEQEFEVSPEQLRQDISALVSKLLEHNLVTAKDDRF